MDVVLVLGTRPQIIKSALFIHLAERDKGTDLEIVHTGQHYDYEMTKIFFEELRLPDPTVNLNVGSGTHAGQTANIMMKLEGILAENMPDLVIVPGDTNSTLAGALTAAKLHIPIAHIEAGARSYDMDMPEEINRRLTDHCSDLLLTPSENCTGNLVKEGMKRDQICETGDTMYDVLLHELPKAEKTDILQELSLEPETYGLLTAHRPENVDNKERLVGIMEAIIMLGQFTIVFPMHPRTKKQLQKFGLYDRILKHPHIRLLDPIGYHETLNLIRNAALVLTDSGGMQKEAFWLKTPCVTLRENTEWVETIQVGANRLAGADTHIIQETARAVFGERDEIKRRMQRTKNPFGDGKASQRILEIIKSEL